MFAQIFTHHLFASFRDLAIMGIYKTPPILQQQLQLAHVSNPSPRMLQRMQGYVFQHLITNTWFTTLHGRTPSPLEQKCACYLGAFTPIYDDLMDEEGYSHEQICELLNHHALENPHHLLIQQLHHQYLTYIADHERFHCYFSQAGKAQNNSLKQHKKQDIALSEMALREISDTKGGNFTLLFRTSLAEPISELEYQAIWELGALLQLENDIFDIYTDRMANILTRPNSLANPSFLREEYEARMAMVIRKLREIAISKSHGQVAAFQILLVLCRGLVCLDQLKSLYVRKKEPPNPFERKLWICDMEKWENIRKNLWYTVKWWKSLKN